MELTELVRAIMSGNLLEARQWVADARRAGLRWQECERPSGLDDRAMTIAAGLRTFGNTLWRATTNVDDSGWDKCGASFS